MPAPRVPVEIREYARPELPAGAALLRTSRSEVCGTDVHLWHGRLSSVPYPIIPGHVSAGVLESIRGPLVGIDGTRLKEGDRAVFFDVHRTCGRCRACTVHHTPTRCVARRVYGITDSADDGLFGGWSQYIYLEPGVGIAKLPDAVGVDDYIGGGCGLLTAVHIIERASLQPGESVLVQGAGAVGLSVDLNREAERGGADLRDRRPGAAARPRPRHGCRHRVPAGRDDGGGATRGGARRDLRRGRRRRDRSRRFGAGD